MAENIPLQTKEERKAIFKLIGEKNHQRKNLPRNQDRCSTA